MPIHPHQTPVGDPSREAIDSLRGYVYQIYQSALAWIAIKDDEFLFLEVAEDFAIVAKNALQAVQVKETASNVTINSDDIISSINGFIELQKQNPNLNVSLRHLTTSKITLEQKKELRIGNTPTLESWRNLAKTGDLTELRNILKASKLSNESKQFIESLDDNDLREKLLKKVHFDCGAPDSKFLPRQLKSQISKLIIDRNGVHSQTEACTASIMLSLLKKSTLPNRDDRYLDRADLESHLEYATQITLNRAQFEIHNQQIEKALSFSTKSLLANSQSIKANLISAVILPNALARREKYHPWCIC